MDTVWPYLWMHFIALHFSLFHFISIQFVSLVQMFFGWCAIDKMCSVHCACISCVYLAVISLQVNALVFHLCMLTSFKCLFYAISFWDAMRSDFHTLYSISRLSQCIACLAMLNTFAESFEPTVNSQQCPKQHKSNKSIILEWKIGQIEIHNILGFTLIQIQHFEIHLTFAHTQSHRRAHSKRCKINMCI